MHPLVSCFVVRYSVLSSPPLLNLLEWLSETNRVVLVVEGVFEDLSPLQEKGIRVVDLTRLPEEEMRAQTGLDPEQVEHWLVVDPAGLNRCRRLYPEVRPIYYSLELYLPGEKDPYCPEEVIQESIRHAPAVRALIFPSEEREGLFRKAFRIPSGVPALILPITFKTPANASKSDYLRKRYAIQADRRIALHLGEICGKYNSANIARSFNRLDGWVLIFHGFSRPAYKRAFAQRLKQQQNVNVLVSEEYCKDIKDLDRILASADVGIAWYSNTNSNFATAGQSSNKITGYLGHGVPVVANRLPSTRAALEASGCGLTVRSESDIPHALEQITRDEAGYRSRCLEEFDRTYYFNAHRENLQHFFATLTDPAITR